MTKKDSKLKWKFAKGSRNILIIVATEMVLKEATATGTKDYKLVNLVFCVCLPKPALFPIVSL